MHERWIPRTVLCHAGTSPHLPAVASTREVMDREWEAMWGQDHTIQGQDGLRWATQKSQGFLSLLYT